MSLTEEYTDKYWKLLRRWNHLEPSGCEDLTVKDALDTLRKIKNNPALPQKLKAGAEQLANDIIFNGPEPEISEEKLEEMIASGEISEEFDEDEEL